MLGRNPPYVRWPVRQLLLAVRGAYWTDALMEFFFQGWERAVCRTPHCQPEEQLTGASLGGVLHQESGN